MNAAEGKDAFGQPIINLSIARAYLMLSDAKAVTRTCGM